MRAKCFASVHGLYGKKQRGVESKHEETTKKRRANCAIRTKFSGNSNRPSNDQYMDNTSCQLQLILLENISIRSLRRRRSFPDG